MDANTLCELINEHVAGFQCLFEKDGKNLPGFQVIEKAFLLRQEDYRPQLIDPLEWTPTTIILASQLGNANTPPTGWIFGASVIEGAEPIKDGISIWSARHVLRIHRVLRLREKEANHAASS